MRKNGKSKRVEEDLKRAQEWESMARLGDISEQEKERARALGRLQVKKKRKKVRPRSRKHFDFSHAVDINVVSLKQRSALSKDGIIRFVF